MLHATSPSAAISAPAFTPGSHPDAELANLMPVLQAAFRERAAYRDHCIRSLPSEPDHGAVLDRDRSLGMAVDTAATRMLALRPRTITGLLLTAHAAAASMDWLWDDDAQDDQEPAERVLRTLCDNLFGLFGVDRHDRYVGGPPVPDADPATERAILRMLTNPGPGSAKGASAEQHDPIFAAIEASGIALDEHIAACNAEDADTVEGDARRTAAGDAAYQAWRALLATPPTTAAGAQALARRALDQLERGGCWRDENNEEDARALFRAIAAAGTSDGGAPTVMAAPEGVLVAAAAHREAHVAMLAARGPHDTAFEAARARKDDAFKALLRTRPTSETGWRVYTTAALFEIARCLVDIGTVPDGWADAAGCMLNGGIPLTEDALPPAFSATLERRAQQPFLMAAE